ncbi:hypothetical protein HDU90_004942 [Geranomyces variabilis]|nr:hypothetical protein HDU90_004942 [Geranomyces variabilis]
MTIVHVILFKVKPTAEQEAFVTNVKTLATLPGVHNALNAYSVSDAHQQVIKTHIAPNIEPGSTMCLDYEK